MEEACSPAWECEWRDARFNDATRIARDENGTMPARRRLGLAKLVQAGVRRRAAVVDAATRGVHAMRHLL